MRYAAKVDANQVEIVAAIRARGATVAHLHSVGKGVPDLLVGYLGINLLFEIKDGEKSASQRRLTPDQIKWHSEWDGSIEIITSVDEAINFLDLILEGKQGCGVLL